MNLTKANIKALRKVTVKIECFNNNIRIGHHRFCRREPLCPYCCTYNTKRYQGWPSRQRADRYFAQEEQPDIPLNCG